MSNLDKLKKIENIINHQKMMLAYNSYDCTIKHKECVYQAFLDLLRLSPVEVIDYLLNNSRKGGFQSKIFQKYVYNLEKCIPYYIRKYNKVYEVQSLLDPNLCLFDGISIFTGTVDSKLEIKNNTEEIYVGGRKSYYSQPYFIGKILDVQDIVLNVSLLNNIKEYTFNKIKMSQIEPNLEVKVTHLRAPPHYQMGGMTYINRIRNKIIKEALV